MKTLFIERIPLKDIQLQTIDLDLEAFKKKIPEGFTDVGKTLQWQVYENHIVISCQIAPSTPPSPYPGDPR